LGDLAQTRAVGPHGEELVPRRVGAQRVARRVVPWEAPACRAATSRRSPVPSGDCKNWSPYGFVPKGSQLDVNTTCPRDGVDEHARRERRHCWSHTYNLTRS
jgi:hypothetical protein